MQTRQIEIRGNILSYRTEGEGTDAIIFLHGWRSEGLVWIPAVTALGKRPEKIIIPDLPGFGMSEAGGKSMTLGDYAQVVRELIAREVLREGNVTIIGHSFGARIGAKIASENPSWLSRLILVASGGNRPDRAKRTGMRLIAKCLKPLFLPRFMHGLRNMIYTAIGAEDYVAKPELQRTLTNILNEDIGPMLEKIRVQTLIVWGDKDDMAPIAYGRKMAGLIPGAKMKIMEGMGHWCFRERPEEFAHVVRDFLGK